MLIVLSPPSRQISGSRFDEVRSLYNLVFRAIREADEPDLEDFLFFLTHIKMKRRVVGVDAGYVNFATCGIDSDGVFRPYHWTNEALFTGKFTEERLCKAIYEWINRPDIKTLLDEADQIVLERQMAMKFQAINHCIRFRYFDKTIEVSPSTVGKQFKLPSDRRSKKKRAVELVGTNVPLPISKGKKDDLADSYLLAAYGLFQHSPELKEGWKDVDSGDSGARKPAKGKPRSGGRKQPAAVKSTAGPARGYIFDF